MSATLLCVCCLVTDRYATLTGTRANAYTMLLYFYYWLTVILHHATPVQVWTLNWTISKQIVLITYFNNCALLVEHDGFFQRWKEQILFFSFARQKFITSLYSLIAIYLHGLIRIMSAAHVQEWHPFSVHLWRHAIVWTVRYYLIMDCEWSIIFLILYYC